MGSWNWLLGGANNDNHRVLGGWKLSLDRLNLTKIFSKIQSIFKYVSNLKNILKIPTILDFYEFCVWSTVSIFSLGVPPFQMSPGFVDLYSCIWELSAKNEYSWSWLCTKQTKNLIKLIKSNNNLRNSKTITTKCKQIKNIARGTTDPEIDSAIWIKLGNNMAPLTVANLATRWHHLH